MRAITYPSVGVWAALELGIAVPPSLGILELWIVLTPELGIADNTSLAAQQQSYRYCCQHEAGAGKAPGVRPHRASINWL